MPFGLRKPPHPLRRSTDRTRRRDWRDVFVYATFAVICVIVGMLHPAFITVFVIGVLSAAALFTRG